MCVLEGGVEKGKPMRTAKAVVAPFDELRHVLWLREGVEGCANLHSVSTVLDRCGCLHGQLRKNPTELVAVRFAVLLLA